MAVAKLVVDEQNPEKYKLINEIEVRYPMKFEQLTFLSDAHFSAPNSDKTSIGVYCLYSGALFCELNI